MNIFDRVPVVGVEGDAAVYRIPRQLIALLLWMYAIRGVWYGLDFIRSWPVTGPLGDVVVIFRGIAALIEVVFSAVVVIMFVDWICRESKMQYDRGVITRACNTKVALPRSSAR